MFIPSHFVIELESGRMHPGLTQSRRLTCAEISSSAASAETSLFNEMLQPNTFPSF